MRRPSVDQVWARGDQAITLPSHAMPGFQLRVWRTDGKPQPPPERDMLEMVNMPFKKNQVTNFRHYYELAFNTYEIAVETMPTVPELPEELENS